VTLISVRLPPDGAATLSGATEYEHVGAGAGVGLGVGVGVGAGAGAGVGVGAEAGCACWEMRTVFPATVVSVSRGLAD
jgi:hypothetical protein